MQWSCNKEDSLGDEMNKGELRKESDRNMNKIGMIIKCSEGDQEITRTGEKIEGG